MPDSTNTHLAGVQTLSDGGPGGTEVTDAAASKASVYGKTPVIQADAIVAVTGVVSLTTTINALLTAIRNYGIIA